MKTREKVLLVEMRRNPWLHSAGGSSTSRKERRERAKETSTSRGKRENGVSNTRQAFKADQIAHSHSKHTNNQFSMRKRS